MDVAPTEPLGDLLSLSVRSQLNGSEDMKIIGMDISERYGLKPGLGILNPSILGMILAGVNKKAL